MNAKFEGEDISAIVERRDHDRRGHERLTRDRRRKKRQTFAQFQAHVDAYCAKKKGKK